MNFDGLLSDAEAVADLFVEEPGANSIDHLVFA